MDSFVPLPQKKCAKCGEVIRGVPHVLSKASHSQVVRFGCIPLWEAHSAREDPNFHFEEIDPLVLTLHIVAESDAALKETRLSASCTSIAGDELAAVSGLCASDSLQHVRVLLAAEMSEMPERLVFMLPNGRVFSRRDLRLRWGSRATSTATSWFHLGSWELLKFLESLNVCMLLQRLRSWRNASAW